MTVLLTADEVTLSVAEYRPVYVNGDVAKPGQQTFRAGLNPTCAESGPFLDSTEIGASQIKGLRRTKHRFDDVVPTAAVDADQSS